MARYISTKLFDNYSVAIRQYKAAHSHCQLLHGYALKFKVWFASNEPLEENQLDDMNWIVDFGGFKEPPRGNGLKAWMDYMFDHTMLIAEDDPFIKAFQEMQTAGVAQIRILPAVGAEQFAKFIFEKFDKDENGKLLTRDKLFAKFYTPSNIEDEADPCFVYYLINICKMLVLIVVDKL